IGLLLIVFGIALLIFEIKVPSFGVLGTGGAAALVIGSVMITNELPGVRVSSGFVIPVALSVAGILLFLGRLAVKAQRIISVTGAEGLVGARGQTLTTVGPDQPGQISVHGEIWRATSAMPIPSGRDVRVTTLTGLTLFVEPLAPDLRTGDAS
ncbi:MAG: NfeD family protein, partial [Vicinamibacterales bacterium]